MSKETNMSTNILSFKDFNLLESFDIKDKPLKMSIPNQEEYVIKYLAQKYDNAIDVFNSMKKHYNKITVFKINKSKEYIIFLMQNNDTIGVHFNNFHNIDNSSNLGGEKLSVELFSDIFNIVYYYGLFNDFKTVITHDDSNRLKLYLKIVQKVLNKYKPEFKVIIKNNNLVIYKENKLKPFTERFL